MAMKKAKAQERTEEADVQLREKMVAQILTGVNRAFPFADTNNPTFEKQLDTIFRITHSSNFNTSVQALMLLQQITSSKHYGAERFYRTLYESLLDPRLFTSSKQVMYLNLLYKSLKADLNAKRVQAFVKRLLQIITLHEPPFVCGVLYLISELERTFPSIRNMIKDPEYDEEDEEEHFVDAPEDGDDTVHPERKTQFAAKTISYDPRKRDPEHAHAERSCLWDILPFLRHFHPSVSLFAESIAYNKDMPPKPDPTQHTLMQFLDRFVYRNAKSKQVTAHGSSIMQPMGGSSAADLLVKPSGERTAAPVNTESFWQKKVEDVAADEVFFHSYFNQAGGKKPKTSDKKKSKARDSDDSEDDEGEDEIWKALVNSRPDVEGGDDDDDIDLDDLEAAYSDSDDDGSEPGLDMGGDSDAEEGEGMVLDAEEGDSDMDGFPDFDDEDEDAFLDDEDEVPVDFDDEEEVESEKDEKELSRSQQKRKERKKLKSLPVFASMEGLRQVAGCRAGRHVKDFLIDTEVIIHIIIIPGSMHHSSTLPGRFVIPSFINTLIHSSFIPSFNPFPVLTHSAFNHPQTPPA